MGDPIEVMPVSEHKARLAVEETRAEKAEADAELHRRKFNIAQENAERFEGQLRESRSMLDAALGSTGQVDLPAFLRRLRQKTFLPLSSSPSVGEVVAEVGEALEVEALTPRQQVERVVQRCRETAVALADAEDSEDACTALHYMANEAEALLRIPTQDKEEESSGVSADGKRLEVTDKMVAEVMRARRGWHSGVRVNVDVPEARQIRADLEVAFALATPPLCDSHKAIWNALGEAGVINCEEVEDDPREMVEAIREFTTPTQPKEVPGEECERWKVDDDYPCRAQKPDGSFFVFDDLLREGSEVGLGPISEDDEDREGRPPFGRVVRESDGLWIVQNSDAEERDRSERIIASINVAPYGTGKKPPEVVGEANEKAVNLLAERLYSNYSEMAGSERRWPDLADVTKDSWREDARSHLAALAHLLTQPPVSEVPGDDRVDEARKTYEREMAALESSEGRKPGPADGFIANGGDGLRLETWRITPECQSRGRDVAWEDAAGRLKAVFDTQLARAEEPITLTVSIERESPAPTREVPGNSGVREIACENCGGHGRAGENCPKCALGNSGGVEEGRIAELEQALRDVRFHTGRGEAENGTILEIRQTVDRALPPQQEEVPDGK